MNEALSQAVPLITLLGIALLGVAGGIAGFVLTYQSGKKVIMIICMTVEFVVLLILIGAVTLAAFANPAATAHQTLNVRPTPTLTRSTSPTPTASPLYYQADWSRGPGDWVLASHWSWSNANGSGMLVTDGQESNSWIFPATHLQNADYTLQVAIRRQSYTNVGGPSFGIAVHYAANTGSYVCGVGNAIQPEHYFLALATGHNGQIAINHDLTRKSVNLDQQWHIYRIDVQGQRMTLSVDGSFVMSVTDATYTGLGQIGLYASAAIINIKDLVVRPLTV